MSYEMIEVITDDNTRLTTIIHNGKKFHELPIPDSLIPNPLSGYSCNGINVWGDEKSMKAVRNAFDTAATVNELRNLIAFERSAFRSFENRMESICTNMQKEFKK